MSVKNQAVVLAKLYEPRGESEWSIGEVVIANVNFLFFAAQQLTDCGQRAECNHSVLRTNNKKWMVLRDGES